MRRISVSQWSDMAKMSDCLLKDYVYSYKANSARMMMPGMNEDIIRRELHNMFEKTKQNENHVEVVLKDLHTISDKPEQVIRWVELAREVFDGIVDVNLVKVSSADRVWISRDLSGVLYFAAFSENSAANDQNRSQYLQRGIVSYRISTDSSTVCSGSR